MPSKLPNALKKGDTIGLVCSAGGFDDYKPIELVIKYLKSKGFNVKLGKSLIVRENGKKTFNYLSGPDVLRANDINNFFSDDDINAIFCLRGGYGCTRLLHLLDYKLISKKKKILIGYSDITALLLALYKKANLISFHGPMLGLRKKKLLKSAWDVLFNKSFNYKTPNAKKIRGGKASGVLLGGNLTVLCSMIGSPYIPSFKNSILFLEDCNEEPYKLDRLFTQLENAGVLNEISGLILGSFTNCKFKNTQELKSFFLDKVGKYKIPIVYNFPVGHGKENLIMPVGMKVLLDADKIVLRSLK